MEINFTKLSTLEKWEHIERGMKAIQQLEVVADLRSRYNTNHAEYMRAQELRNIRTNQYVKWLELKDLYAGHRDELANTQENEAFISCRSIMERIFTNELDDVLRDITKE